MRKNQSIRNRGKRRRQPVLDLDITSLLDILVIMLVFLLKSYNSSGIVLNYSKDIKLPYSSSSNPNTTGVIIQISEDKIWVDDQEIVDLKKAKVDAYYRSTVFERASAGRLVIPLYNELNKKKSLVKQVEKSAQNAKKFSGIVNLIIDKKIRFYDIRKVLYTVAEAGYRQYKFVVLSEEQ